MKKIKIPLDEFIKQLQKGTDWGTPVTSFIGWFKSFFIRQPKIKVTYTSKKQSQNSTSSSKPSKTDQDEIDIILDKISASGYESLTTDEKQKLFNASKK